MKVIDITQPDSFNLAIREIHQHPIVVQLSTVFVLLAAPTSAGAAQLDDTKKRLPGKNYGTAIGSLTNFLSQADPASLPEGFKTRTDFLKMTGSFIRLNFRYKTFQSATIRNGTHQGVLLDGVYKKFFSNIEASFAYNKIDQLWGEKNYHAPLCTSCNISGHPDGSITNMEKALEFAYEKDIKLFVKSQASKRQLGSYPIFAYTSDKITIEREGPGLEEFKAKIPTHLRTWESSQPVTY